MISNLKMYDKALTRTEIEEIGMTEYCLSFFIEINIKRKWWQIFKPFFSKEYKRVEIDLKSFNIPNFTEVRTTLGEAVLMQIEEKIV